MDASQIKNIGEKHRRVTEYLERNGFDALVIGRQDNFSWYTCGGDNKVVITSELGFGILIIMPHKVYLVAHTMDGPRIMDEELCGLDVEPVFLRWYEAGREEKVSQLLKGKKVLADIPLPHSVFSPQEIYFKLHYPLLDVEIDRLRWIGMKSEQIIRKVADQCEAGMSERELEAKLLALYASAGLTADALMVGSDERISRYRHPLPSDKKVEKCILLHSCVRKWGLHVSISRMVYLGKELPCELSDKYDAACRIEASVLSRCVPGERFYDILEAEKQAYRDTGFGEEWRNHFQGGITGYLLDDSSQAMDPEARLSVNQAYDYFITITGVKTEELCINTGAGIEIPSSAGDWPVKKYISDGKEFMLPQILTGR